MRLKGKVALITGASEGIGLATALRFAEEGARVVICARRPGPLTMAKELIQSAGGEIEAISVDVGNAEEYATCIQDVGNRYGRLDILMNNAFSNMPGSVVDLPLESWRRDFKVNTEAMFIGTKEALKIMYRQRSGSVINVTSTSSLRAIPNISSYSASKAAAAHFSYVAATEAAPYNVRVNVIAPGQHATPATQTFLANDPAYAEACLDVIPMHRVGQPREAANVALFLASDESSYVTGICIPVDGGMGVQLYFPSFSGEENFDKTV